MTCHRYDRNYAYYEQTIVHTERTYVRSKDNINSAPLLKKKLQVKYCGKI